MYEAILEEILKADSIVVFGHISPDGDCYGCQIALRDSIRETFKSKKCYAVGTGLPNFYDAVGTMDEIDDDAFINSLGIMVDCSDIERIEDQRVRLCKKIIIIDHHLIKAKFNGVSVVDVASSSCAHVIYQILKESKMIITQSVANALYLGLLTDTGRFLYLENDNRSFKMATELWEYGVQAKRIGSLSLSQDKHSIKFKGFTYKNYKSTKNGVAYLVVKSKDLKKMEYTANKAASNVNLLQNIKGYPIWAFFVETGNGNMRVEMRSSKCSVQPIAVKYGGGGHLLASGISQIKYSKQNIKDILQDLDDAIGKE